MSGVGRIVSWMYRFHSSSTLPVSQVGRMWANAFASTSDLVFLACFRVGGRVGGPVGGEGSALYARICRRDQWNIIKSALENLSLSITILLAARCSASVHFSLIHEKRKLGWRTKMVGISTHLKRDEVSITH